MEQPGNEDGAIDSQEHKDEEVGGSPAQDNAAGPVASHQSGKTAPFFALRWRPVMKPSMGARHMNSQRPIVAVVETGSHFMKDGRFETGIARCRANRRA